MSLGELIKKLKVGFGVRGEERGKGKVEERKAGDVEEMVSPRENSQVEEDQNDEGDQS